MSRIQLLLDNRENARLLSEMLGRRHELTAETNTEAPIDLAIVDAPCLKVHAPLLIARKQQEDPVLFPVLLVTTRQNVGLFTGPVFKAIDEVVLTPVEKVELFARVEMMLRARRLSLELRLRKDDLEAFIHAMTHDLRAPLRTVSGFAEAMAEDQSSRLDAAGKHQLDRIQGAVKQMWELIESLAEFSRIGRKGVKLKTVDVGQLLDRCMEEMRNEIDSSHAEVHAEGPLDAVEADAALLKIAVCNLISNAIKYVAPGVTPQLDIRTERTGNITRIFFHDNGIGLKTEDQQRVFAPFVRLHGIEDYPGLGLGLSATRRVVEIIGGQIGVDSTPGGGSTFWIELMAGGDE